MLIRLAIDIFARFNENNPFLLDNLHSRTTQVDKEHVENYLKDLPEQFSYDELEKIVRKDAEANTTNNDMGMEKSFHTREIQKDLKNGRDIKKITTSSSPLSNNDLQLVLNQFARSNVNVLFVIQPVNKKVDGVQGLSEEMYQHAVEKIRYQLESQGFTNIADFQKWRDPYFVKDTIHLGWLGWLAFDKVVNPFLTDPTPAQTTR